MPIQSSWLSATGLGLIGKGVGAKGEKEGSWSWDEELKSGGKAEAFCNDAGKSSDLFSL